MKKIIFLLTFTLLSFSCSKDDDNSSSSNINGDTTNGNMNYEFTITINGQVHKVKGNSKDGIPFSPGQNDCWAQFVSGFGAMVVLDIHDVTQSNYISGQNMKITIRLPNPLLGTNQATLSFTGNYFDTLATSLGAFIYTGFNSYSSTLVTVNGASSNTNIPIIITDLGTPRTTKTPYDFLSPYNYGQTIKGNYSGTIYLQRCSNLGSSGGGCYYDIPVKLSIDFKALRLN